ncbi:hypothetical protein QYF36_024060 [Acer negundo]|nr:hypothetical protein QYF36_024060 [Acer negundo]
MENSTFQTFQQPSTSSTKKKNSKVESEKEEEEEEDENGEFESSLKIKGKKSFKVDVKIDMPINDGKYLRHKLDQTVQEYTTEFHNQAITLGISMEGHDIFMKFMGGLAESIRKELKLFNVRTINEVTIKAIMIESKNKESDKELL